MATVKVSAGKLEVLSSGSVVAYQDETVRLDIDFGDVTPFRLEVIFKPEPQEKQGPIYLRVMGPAHVAVEFSNILARGPIATATPIRVGDWENTSVYFSAAVWVIGETKEKHSVILDYTLGIGERPNAAS